MFRRYSILGFFLVIALVTMACGFSINLPVDKIRTGPTQVDDINIAVPEVLPADVEIVFGAGDLEISSGAEDLLIGGEATYNVEDFKPEIEEDGSSVRLSTGELEISGIPNINVSDLVNEWDLHLGDAVMNLKINAGAYQAQYDLGGLSLESLDVSDGAADVRLEFSEINKTDMRSFRYSTGASTVKLSGLANANFGLMNFRSGAGDYTLDFSGELQRDSNVVIESGVSHIIIIVPEDTNAVVTFRGGLTNVDFDSGWDVSGNTYSLSGGGPRLVIEVEMGAGSLELRSR